MLRHIVSWKLNGANVAEVDAQFERIANDLESLNGVIPELHTLRVVRNVVNRGKNFDAAVIADFADEAHLRAYIEHPAHVEASEYLRSVVAERACVDYVV